jgi:hypothetical protein
MPFPSAESSLSKKAHYKYCFKPDSSFSFCCLLLFLSLLLAACSMGNGTNTSGSATPTTSLSQLKWCSKPSMVFRDEGASGTSLATPGAIPTAVSGTPTTITDWNQVKDRLGFTLYLPASLSSGTCVISAFGTIHDPVFGSSFTIGFMLPTHDSISLSEAPLRSQDPKFQCNASATGTPTGSTATSASSGNQAGIQICNGAHNSTNIVFSARGSASNLQQFFNNLQPNVNWIPAAS